MKTFTDVTNCMEIDGKSFISWNYMELCILVERIVVV